MRQYEFKSFIDISSDSQFGLQNCGLSYRIREYNAIKDNAIKDNAIRDNAIRDNAIRDNAIIDLPKDTVKIIGDINYVTSYNYGGILGQEIVKSVKEYRFENKTFIVSKAVSNRRKWTKFGVSSGLGSGPDSASTSIVCDEVFFEPIRKNQIKDDTEDDNSSGIGNIFSAVGGSGGKVMKCRYCKGPHWSRKCTNRDNVSDIENSSKSKVLSNKQSSNEKPGNKKFDPSSLSDGAGGSRKKEKNENTIRVSNISENAVENDIRVLFDRCGYIRRLHYKVGKGYAFITFDSRLF